MKLLVLFIALIALGCERKEPDPKRELTNYKCEPNKIELVDRQYKICNNSGYMSSYCYLTAVANNCEYTGEKSK